LFGAKFSPGEKIGLNPIWLEKPQKWKIKDRLSSYYLAFSLKELVASI
jgi:hypothetical protein